MSQRALITGASGFIGRSLCGLLHRRGYAVIGAGRCNPDAGAAPSPLERYFRLDLAAFQAGCAELFEGVDAVVHLAARVHVMDESDGEHGVSYEAVNVDATRKLALAAAEHGVKTFVFISTAKVSGAKSARLREGWHRYTEKDPPQPSGAYAHSKWRAEQVLWDLKQRPPGNMAGNMAGNMKIVVLRIPLVYGERVKANFLQLLRLCRSGIPLPLMGVQNLRSMLYVGNLADAIEKVLAAGNRSDGLFMVSDYDLSTPELISRLVTAMGKPTRLWLLPTALLLAGARVTGNSAAAERLLGSLLIDSGKFRRTYQWHPPHALDEGLQNTTQWFLRTQLS